MMDTERELWELFKEIQEKIATGEAQDSSHVFFVKLQEMIFEPYKDLEIKPNEAVVDLSPRVDLLYESWEKITPEHKKRLPDGIAQCKTRLFLLELKNTQSLNKDNLTQAFYYHELFRKKQSLKEKDLETFLVLSRTPRKSSLAKFGYKRSKFNGVYRSAQDPWNAVCILVANELDEKPNNAPVMLFASRKKIREKGYRMLMDSTLFPKDFSFKI